MFKKITVSLFIFLILNLTSFVFANESLKASWRTNFSASECAKGEIVEFIALNSDFYPKGTIIRGRVISHKQPRWAYRRAKAKIRLYEAQLPDGTVQTINGRTKRRVLKGSAALNVLKGAIMTAPALVVTVAGGVVIFVEAITIVLIPLTVPTGAAFGGIIGKLTNGVDYKAHNGDSIKLLVK